MHQFIVVELSMDLSIPFRINPNPFEEVLEEVYGDFQFLLGLIQREKVCRRFQVLHFQFLLGLIQY